MFFKLKNKMSPQERFNFDFYLREHDINSIDFDKFFEDYHFIQMQFVLEELKKKIPEEERYLASPKRVLFVIEKAKEVKTIAFLLHNYFFDHKFLNVIQKCQILLSILLNIRESPRIIFLNRMDDFNDQAIGRARRIDNKEEIIIYYIDFYVDDDVDDDLIIGPPDNYYDWLMDNFSEPAIGRAIHTDNEREINDIIENIKPHKKRYQKTHNKLNSRFNKNPYKKRIGHFPGKNKNR